MRRVVLVCLLCAGDVRGLHSCPRRRSSDVMQTFWCLFGLSPRHIPVPVRMVCPPARLPMQALWCPYGVSPRQVTVSVRMVCPPARLTMQALWRPYGVSPRQATVSVRRVDRKGPRLNSSHCLISYAVSCL